MVFGYTLKKPKAPPEDAAIIINNRVITKKELEKIQQYSLPYIENQQELINSVITRELLIQEAKKAGIDREEAFRRSIQNFYEQSLIKNLLDRKFSSINIEITEDEIKAMIEAQNKRLLLRIGRYPTLREAEQADIDSITPKTVSFRKLAEPVQYRLIPLKEGKRIGPFRLDSDFVVIKIERIEEIPGLRISEKKAEEIRDRLRDIKRNIMIEEWIDRLRSEARVIVNPGR